MGRKAAAHVRFQAQQRAHRGARHIDDLQAIQYAQRR